MVTQRELNYPAPMDKHQPALPAQGEFEGLLRSGARRLADSELPDLSLLSGFTRSGIAARVLAVAALRPKGYRLESRCRVLQCLQHAVDLPNEQWRALDQACFRRERAEYHRVMHIDEQLVDAMRPAAREIEQRVTRLIEGASGDQRAAQKKGFPSSVNSRGPA